MKKNLKTTVKILICIVLVFNSVPSEVCGRIPHIISGSLFSALTVIHIALSCKYFFACIKNFTKIKAKAKINLIIDLTLIILHITVITTGIVLACSKTTEILKDPHDLEVFHGVTAAAIVFLIIAHACLHIKKRRKA